MTRVFGSKNAPNQRVSESLDYEPVQNKIFYERMRQAKKERHLFGSVALHGQAQAKEPLMQHQTRLISSILAVLPCSGMTAAKPSTAVRGSAEPN